MASAQDRPTPKQPTPPQPSSLPKESIDFLSYQSLLLDQIHDAVIAADERLVIQFWNQAAEKLLGWKVEEAVGKSTAEIFHTDFISMEHEKLREQILQQGCVELSGISYTRTGQPVFLDMRATKLQDPNGQVRGYVAIIRDLTEQKQAAERIHQLNEELTQRNAELVRERERWQSVVEGIAEEVWLCDLQGSASLINLRTVSPLGLEEFRDKPLDQVLEEMEILNPDGQVRVPKHAPLLRALKGEIVRGEEIMRHTNTGSSRYRQYSSAPTRAPDGTISGAVAIVRDITDYKLAERALRASEERLQLATEAARLGTWEWWPGQDYSVTNEMFMQIHGLEPKPGLRNSLVNFLQMVHPEDRKRVEELISQSTRGEVGPEPPYRIIRPDGAVRWMQGYRRNIHENGKLARQIGAVMDITELRRLQAQQIEYATQVEVQRRLMEQREQDRQSIARDIHDGPIQTLSSTIFSLQYLMDALHTPAMQVELEQARLNIKSAIQELRDVINELRPPALLRFGLTRAIQQHAEDFTERHPEIELRLDLSPDENQLEEPERLVLFRVYQEAMINVTRHASATQIQVRCEITPEGALLEITDNGKGFTVPADFSGFTQTKHYGLAGMKERVESVKGRFEVQSGDGEGTRIKVMI